MLTQCDDCPRRAAGLAGPCIGQFMVNDAYCVMARMGDPTHVAAILTWQPCGDAGAAEAPGTPAWTPAPLDPEEYARLRAAETCPHRDCTGCGCKGCRCGPEGRRPGQVVTILDCLACVATGPARPASSGSGS